MKITQRFTSLIGIHWVHPKIVEDSGLETYTVSILPYWPNKFGEYCNIPTHLQVWSLSVNIFRVVI